MATDDFPLLDSHSQAHLHSHTRHFPSSSSSSPTRIPTSNDAGDSANGDYYPNTFHDDGNADGSSDPNKSTLNSKRAGASTANSPYYHNKKLRSSAAAGSSVTSGDPDSGADAAYRADYRKDREEWSDTAIACLLDAYTEKFNQLNRGNLRGRDWEEVAEAVSERCGGGSGSDGKPKSYKSVEQCKNKIDNLKKRYKVELQRINSGGMTTSHWHWFKKIEAIVGNSISVKTASDEEKGGANSSSMTRQPKNRYLLFCQHHCICLWILMWTLV